MAPAKRNEDRRRTMITSIFPLLVANLILVLTVSSLFSWHNENETFSKSPSHLHFQGEFAPRKSSVSQGRVGAPGKDYAEPDGSTVLEQAAKPGPQHDSGQRRSSCEHHIFVVHWTHVPKVCWNGLHACCSTGRFIRRLEVCGH